MTKDKRRVEFEQRYSMLTIRAKMMGIDLMVFSSYRTASEQNELFREGKSNKDGYENRSKHQDWQAKDHAIVDWNENDEATLIWDGDDPRYRILNELATSLGLRTGFHWTNPRDPYHTELPDGKLSI